MLTAEKEIVRAIIRKQLQAKPKIRCLILIIVFANLFFLLKKDFKVEYNKQKSKTYKIEDFIEKCFF